MQQAGQLLGKTLGAGLSFARKLERGLAQIDFRPRQFGLFNQPADRLTKVWWVEAEAVVSALYMNRLTDDPQYLDVFEQTYDYIENHLVDWEHGEWHANVTTRGTAQGDKANIWKAGYHSGRAMIECLEILKQWKD